MRINQINLSAVARQYGQTAVALLSCAIEAFWELLGTGAESAASSETPSPVPCPNFIARCLFCEVNGRASRVGCWAGAGQSWRLLGAPELSVVAAQNTQHAADYWCRKPARFID